MFIGQIVGLLRAPVDWIGEEKGVKKKVRSPKLQ